MNNIKHVASIIHILGLVLVFGVKAFGQNSTELACKAQAKEVALQTYQSCVTETRQTQIDTLRKEYQQKLSELKDHYNKELKKAAGKEAAENAAPANNEEGSIQLKPNGKKSSKAAVKPTKSLAKTLPKKQFKSAPALPAQSVTDDVAVTVAPQAGYESEAAIVDQELAPTTESAITY